MASSTWPSEPLSSTRAWAQPWTSQRPQRCRPSVFDPSQSSTGVRIHSAHGHTDTIAHARPGTPDVPQRIVLGLDWTDAHTPRRAMVNATRARHNAARYLDLSEMTRHSVVDFSAMMYARGRPSRVHNKYAAT